MDNKAYVTLCERRGYGPPFTKKSVIHKEETDEEKCAIFKPVTDDYPENTLFIGTVQKGKSVLAKKLVGNGKYKTAQNLHVIQKRQMNEVQKKEWINISKKNFNQIKNVWFHEIDNVQQLANTIDQLNSIAKTFSIQNSNKRILNTIYLFDDLQEECMKTTQYSDLITSGSHLSIATLSIFHSVPLKSEGRWNKIADNYNLIVAFNDSSEVRRLFLSEFTSSN